MIGGVAAVAIVVIVLFMRPHGGDVDADAPRPLQPATLEPLKLSVRSRGGAEPPAAGQAPANLSGERITARVATAVTPGKMKAPVAAQPVRPDNTDPTPRPGVASDLPPDAIDLDDASEDIGALTKVAFGDPDPERRLAAVELLSATENPEVITVLARSLADENEEVRMAALQALSDFTGEAPALAIEGALHDPSADIRYEAVSMLAEVGSDRARAAIRQLLNDPDEDVRFLAESVLDIHKEAEPGAAPAAPAQEPAAQAQAPLR
ncbi:MAG TPA: HEAT repeat domain-containing protein [Candidatus Margulisiibacteriota bacterium]|nr:HEAT repeat domain-containing protein [Candidatus Margulisiibacteriota bacterium]